LIEDIRSSSSEQITADGVFVFIGQKPNTKMLEGKINLDSAGYIIADNLMHTKRPGVFAAGDVVSKKYRQLTTAMSDGTIAAPEAVKYICECI
jgi:thioredoxin reductase (NADPH)